MAAAGKVNSCCGGAELVMSPLCKESARPSPYWRRKPTAGRVQEDRTRCQTGYSARWRRPAPERACLRKSPSEHFDIARAGFGQEDIAVGRGAHQPWIVKSRCKSDWTLNPSGAFGQAFCGRATTLGHPDADGVAYWRGQIRDLDTLDIAGPFKPVIRKGRLTVGGGAGAVAAKALHVVPLVVRPRFLT